MPRVARSIARRTTRRVALGAAALALLLGTAQAASTALRYCDRATTLSAAQQDALLRLAAVVRDELDASGARVALLARSGHDLARFGQHYSHAGIGLRADSGAPWAVRQLYYACDERRARLYDQGLAGFVFGADAAATSRVTIVLLPDAEAASLERAARDNALALQLVTGTYSANAHAWSLRYQNCNQWVAELLAVAWGGLAAGADLRERAQRWLASKHYLPTTIDVGSHALMLAATFVPWLHHDDHPADDLHALRQRISMPASIEAFVRTRIAPAARRIELCRAAGRVVVREGWEPIAAGCVPAANDRVVALD
jgi:hypothetical protein